MHLLKISAKKGVLIARRTFNQRGSILSLLSIRTKIKEQITQREEFCTLFEVEIMGTEN